MTRPGTAPVPTLDPDPDAGHDDPGHDDPGHDDPGHDDPGHDPDVLGADALMPSEAPVGAEEPDVAEAAGPPLEERAEQILAFERRWWRRPGAKEQAIRDTFGLSTTRYYQLLNGLLDDPAALVHDPLLVGRLRRLRAWRTRLR